MSNIVELIFRGDVGGLSDSLGRAGQRLGTFGKVAAGAGAIAGAGFGAALSAGMSSAMEIETAMAKLDAQLGVGSEMSKSAGKVAGELYSAAYGESMGDVTAAVATVARGISEMSDASDADLKDVTGQVMSLSQAFDQDLAGTVRAVDQMISTGLAGSSREALDILTAGFQMGNDEAGDLLDTMTEYGTQFRKLGVDGATAMGLISQGLQGGARDADIVADAIKEFSIRSIDGSTATAEGFKAIGLDASDMAKKIAAGGPTASAALDTVLDRLRGMKDPVAQSAAAVALFGTQAEDLGQALFALDPSEATARLGDLAGKAAEVDKAMGDTAAAKVTSMQRGFELWSTSLVATDGALGDVAAMASAFGPQALGMAGSVGMIAAGFGGMIVPIGRAIAAGAAWVAQTVAQGATAAASMVVTAARYVASWVLMAVQSTARAVMMAASWLVAMGPIGWAIAAVVGLVALVIANWDTVSAATSAAWTAVSEWVSGAWESVKSATGSAVDWIMGAIAWFGQLPGLVGGWFGGMKDAAIAKGAELLSWATGWPRRLADLITGFDLAGAGRGLIEGFRRGLSAAWDSVVSWFRGQLAWFRGLFPFSPAKWGPFSGSGYVDRSGAALVGDFRDSLAAGMPAVGRAAEGLMGAAASPLGGPGGGGQAGFRSVVGAPAAARSGGGGVQVTFAGNTSDALATVIMGLIRTGKIQIRPV